MRSDKILFIIGLLSLLTAGFAGCATTKYRGETERNLHYARKFAREGEEVRAAIFYLRVLEKQPNFKEGLKFMYKFYKKHKDRKHAFEYLLKLSQLEPENPEWHYQMGVVLIEEGDEKDGCTELKKAADLSNGSLEIFDKYKEVCKE